MRKRTTGSRRLVHRKVRYTGKTRVEVTKCTNGTELTSTIHESRRIACKHCAKVTTAVCRVCGRAEGCPDDYGGDEPMGQVERCKHCGRWRCPVCASENDCCFEGWEDRMEADPSDCPPGWKFNAKDRCYERIKGWKKGRRKP